MKTSGRSLIYSKKSVGLWIEPFRSPVLIGYSCQNSSSRTTRRCLSEQIISGALIYLSVEILVQKLKIIDNIKITLLLVYFTWYPYNSFIFIDLSHIIPTCADTGNNYCYWNKILQAVQFLNKSKRCCNIINGRKTGLNIYVTLNLLH